jgi:hypothetical protein
MTKKANYINTHPAEFDQGRRARLSSIDEQDAPYDADTDALKAWKAGFDAAEGEAARDETSGPDGGPKAGDQMGYVAGANKAKAN